MIRVEHFVLRLNEQVIAGSVRPEAAHTLLGAPPGDRSYLEGVSVPAMELTDQRVVLCLY